MTMKTIKVADATNTQLDWLVAKCQGYQPVYTNGSLRPVFRRGEAVEPTWPAYTTNPAQMWPIIERERIGLSPWGERSGWVAYTQRDRSSRWVADSALRAAAGCYVIAKLGETVEVPEELV